MSITKSARPSDCVYCKTSLTFVFVSIFCVLSVTVVLFLTDLNGDHLSAV